MGSKHISELAERAGRQFLDSEALEALQSFASPERAAEVLHVFADIPAPSQTAAWTLGPVIEEFLNEWRVDTAAWNPNFKDTGNGVLSIGPQAEKTIWIVAHWDIISFLLAPQNMDAEGYSLVPFHHHVMTAGSQPGRVLRYDLDSKGYKVICSGRIIGGDVAKFCPDEPVKLRLGDRIVYHTPLEALGNFNYSGQLDNAAGCVGALLAGAFLSRLPDVNALVCFVDEEEGPVAHGNTAFARGSQRLLRHLPPPDLAVVVDQQTAVGGRQNPHMGKGALLREHASQARGGVTPPWLYETVRELARTYSPVIELHENIHAGLSRSDCTSLMEVTPNIVLCGPPTVGRHYKDGTYLCSSFDIAHLARSLVMITRHFQ